MNIEDLDWAICYQNKANLVKWLEPSTESDLSRAKDDNIPVSLSPISFVSEHSETLVELNIDTDLLIIKYLADLCLDHSQSTDL